MSNVCLEEAPPQGRSSNSENPDRLRIPTLQGWRGIVLLLAMIVAVGAPLYHVRAIDSTRASTRSDLLPRWVGTRDALRGIDPYSPQALRDIQTAYYGHPLTPSATVEPQAFLYPPHIIVLLAGFARFSWEHVRLMFLVAMPPLIALSVFLCIQWTELRMSRIGILLAMSLSLLSWPMVWGLRLQQPTLMIVVLVFAACYLLKRGNDSAAGILLAMSTIKPQLVAPLILWLLVWAGLKRSWSFFAGFAVTMAILLLWAEHLLPGGFVLWHKSLSGYGQFTHTEMFLEMVFGHWLGTAVTVLVGAWSGLVLWRLRRCAAGSFEFGFAIALILAATDLVSPTKLAMIYNQVLLIPAILLLISARPSDYPSALLRRISLALLAWEFLAVPIAVAGEIIFGVSGIWTGLPFENIFLPVAVTLALLYACPAYPLPRADAFS